MTNIEGWIARVLVSACACLTLGAASPQVATWTVTTIADTNDGVCDADCSLREAIDVAATGDTIDFSSLFATPQTIVLTSGALSIDAGLAIEGPDADLLTIQAGAGSGAFVIQPGVFDVRLSGMTITGASLPAITNDGELFIDACVLTGNTDTAIVNNDFLTITHTTVTDNTGDLVGGIMNTSYLEVINSTISGNLAVEPSPGAGGIYNTFVVRIESSTISGNIKLGGITNGGGIYHSSPVLGSEIEDSTITNNSGGAILSAGGLLVVSGGMIISNTIIAANVGNATTPDVAEIIPGIISAGFNFIGHCAGGIFNFLMDQEGTPGARLDPLLEPLGDYGGMTYTHRLQSGSPALDSGMSTTPEDQRGFRRPVDHPSRYTFLSNTSDIGAFELQTTILLKGGVFTPVGIPIPNIRVLLRMPNGQRRAVRTDSFGRYRFPVASNTLYQVSVTDPRCDSAPRVVQVGGEHIGDLNFTCAALQEPASFALVADSIGPH